MISLDQNRFSLRYLTYYPVAITMLKIIMIKKHFLLCSQLDFSIKDNKYTHKTGYVLFFPFNSPNRLLFKQALAQLYCHTGSAADSLSMDQILFPPLTPLKHIPADSLWEIVASALVSFYLAQGAAANEERRFSRWSRGWDGGGEQIRTETGERWRGTGVTPRSQMMPVSLFTWSHQSLIIRLSLCPLRAN